MASMIRHKKPITINTFHISDILQLSYRFKIQVIDQSFKLRIGVDELDFLLCHNACYFCLADAKVERRFVNF